MRPQDRAVGRNDAGKELSHPRDEPEDELRGEKHDYETVVIDSLDWLERLIWDKLCQQYGVASIEKVDGGYARGYTHALTHWRDVINLLNALRNDKNVL